MKHAMLVIMAGMAGLMFAGVDPESGAAVMTNQLTRQYPLDTSTGLETVARAAEIVPLEGCAVLKLDGLALVGGESPGEFMIAVDILAEPPCYPGLVFHIVGKPALPPAGAVMEWELGGQILACEPNGTLNLNRHLMPGIQPVILPRSFILAAPAEVEITAGVWRSACGDPDWRGRIRPGKSRHRCEIRSRQDVHCRSF